VRRQAALRFSAESARRSILNFFTVYGKPCALVLIARNSLW
jgi:hypothetical protein